MEETKYGKYFITTTPPRPDYPQAMNKDNDLPWWTSLYITKEMDGALPGAFYLETNMVLRAGAMDVISEVPHTHGFPEYLVFLGTNPDDQFDLGGEVEFWLGGEQHIITKTCAVFVPAGVPHAPLIMRRVDRPFMFITTGTGSGYEEESDFEEAKKRL